MQGLQQNVSSNGSLDSAYESSARTSSNSYTTITIEEYDERTPLLKQKQTLQSHGPYSTRFDSIQSMPTVVGSNDAEVYSATSTNSLKIFGCSYGAISSAAGGSGGGGDTTTDTDKATGERPVCSLRVILFMSFLISSLFLAAYLLIIESRVPSNGFSLDLVSREIWSKMSLKGLLNHANVYNVLVMQTRGQPCDDADSCIETMKQMQIEQEQEQEPGINGEIPYNFLIGSAGETYEIRGWDYESGFLLMPQNRTLVIGFIGDYTKNPLTQIQQQSANSLLRESVKRRKLQQDYDVYGVRNVSISMADGEALLQAVSTWPRFKMHLHVK